MDSILHIPQFVSSPETLFTALQTKIPWQKVHYFKRGVCHYDGALPECNLLLREISDQFGRPVVGAFLNYYETGEDYAPYHADKYGCDVCLISLGTTRTLRYKPNAGTGANAVAGTVTKNTDFQLQQGDLLFIPNDINNQYKHSLLKTKKVSTPRISILVFLSPSP